MLSIVTYALAKKYTDEAFSKFIGFSIEIIEELPPTDINTHTIYFLKKSKPSGEADFYYEYMYINDKWEIIGSTELDLTDYYTKEEVQKYVEEHTYTLPAATDTTLGGVKIDTNSMNIDGEGTLSVSDEYTETTAQSVVDSNFITITKDEIGNLFAE